MRIITDEQRKKAKKMMGKGPVKMAQPLNRKTCLYPKSSLCPYSKSKVGIKAPNKSVVLSSFGSSSSKEREILTRDFGSSEETVAEIGGVFGFSRENKRQHIVRSLRKLKDEQVKEKVWSQGRDFALRRMSKG